MCGLADLRVQYGDVQLGASRGGAVRPSPRGSRNVRRPAEGGKTILGIQRGSRCGRALATTVELAAIVWPES